MAADSLSAQLKANKSDTSKLVEAFNDLKTEMRKKANDSGTDDDKKLARLVEDLYASLEGLLIRTAEMAVRLDDFINDHLSHVQMSYLSNVDIHSTPETHSLLLAPSV